MRYGQLKYGDEFTENGRKYLRLHTRCISIGCQCSCCPREYHGLDIVFCPARLAELIHADLAGCATPHTYFDIRWSWESPSSPDSEVDAAVTLLVLAKRIGWTEHPRGVGYAVRQPTT